MDDTSGLHLPSTFRALRHRNYRLFFFGQSVSQIGTWMQTIAQQWLVYSLTGSAAMLGTINLVAVLPVGPFALWGGSLADRFSNRSILLVVTTVMMVQAFLLAGLTWSGNIEIWSLLVLATVLGAANAVQGPNRQAFVVEMVEGKEDLGNAISLNSLIFNTARVFGPTLAAVVVATIGEAAAFGINGFTFLAAIAALALMRLPARSRPAVQTRAGAHLLKAVRYVRGRRLILVLMSLVAVSAFLSRPYLVLLPVFADTVVRDTAQPLLDLVCSRHNLPFDCQSPDALTYGILMAANGLGAVLGALAMAALSNRPGRGRWLTLCSLAFPALLVAMSASRSFVLTLILLVGVGFTFIVQNVLANTLIQVSVPDEFRGRIMSFYSLVVLGMTRFGGLQAGFVGDFFGPSLAVGVGALICLAFGLFVAWRFPAVREMA